MQKVKLLDRRVILLVLALGAAAFAGWWFLLRSHAPTILEWQGYAEADFVKAGPTQQGLITEVHAARGDKIARGAPLFDQDDADDRAATEQIARQLAQAEDQLANLKTGGKPTEIEQAEANLADAEAARDKTQTDLARNSSLLKTGAAAAQLVDQETADLRSGNAKVRSLEAALAQLRAPMGREGEIKAQTSAVEAARAALAIARWRLDQRHVVAPVSGVIADVLAQPGETLAAGAGGFDPAAGEYLRALLRAGAVAVEHPSGRSGCHTVRQLSARHDGDRLVHRAAGRIHAACHLQRIDARQVGVPGRGAAKAE